MGLVKDVYELTSHFPAGERFGLTQQLRRVSISIPSNIAQGHGRSRTGDYLRFVSIARGSLAETENTASSGSAIEIFVGRQSISPLMSKADEIGRMLRGLERSLARSFHADAPPILNPRS
jgi:four helix bundle protein